MDRATDFLEFANAVSEHDEREKKKHNLRARGVTGSVGGVSYGISSYGSPGGAVTGVNNPPAADPPLGEQWSGGSGSDDAPAGGDSGAGGSGAGASGP